MDLRRLIAMARSLAPADARGSRAGRRRRVRRQQPPAEGLRGEGDADRWPGALGREPGLHASSSSPRTCPRRTRPSRRPGPILESVIKDLGARDVRRASLASRVQVDAPRDSTLLTITAQDTVPARAAAIANALAEQLIAVSPTIQGREAEFQKSIDEDLTATQDLIQTTQARADALIAIDGANRGTGSGAAGPRGAARQPALDVRHAALLLVGQRHEPAHRRRAGRSPRRRRCCRGRSSTRSSPRPSGCWLSSASRSSWSSWTTPSRTRTPSRRSPA